MSETWMPAVGDGVIYQPHVGAMAEDGTVTEIRGRFAMVLYRGDCYAKATRLTDLRPI